MLKLTSICFCFCFGFQDKNGNPIDLGGQKSSLSVAANAPAPTVTPLVTKQSSEDAGSKLREAALARIAGGDKNKKDNDNNKAVEVAAKIEEKIKADQEAKDKADEELVIMANAKLEVDEKAEGAEKEKALEHVTQSSLQSLLGKKEEESSPAKVSSPIPSTPLEAHVPTLTATTATAPARKSVRKLYTKQELLKFKDLDICLCRPPDLPDMTVERGQTRQPRQQREGGGSSWSRAQAPPRRQSSNTDQPQQQSQQGQPSQNQWIRGHAPPQQVKNKGGRGDQHEPSDDFKPLVKSDNHWKPQKNTSRLVVAEKKVKSILNKMTKEKFQKLAKDMCEIPLESYDILVMIIKKVYEKAIDEPSFGDMYADLCFSLSHVSGATSFVHIVESDEDVTEESKGKVYRWSNDVSTSDSEIVGPFKSPNECDDAALSEEERIRVDRGEIELELISLTIRRGIFIKIMKKIGTEDEFYTVYFPFSEAEECGQQLSEKFLSKAECISDANKRNSFKRSLLNKCEDEFNKQDIYADWKVEKATYEQTKMNLVGGDRERKEKGDELEFRRLKIKKQMLGNIKFIGQLFKKDLLKEKIMRYCIGSLLKLKQVETSKSKNPEYKDSGDMDMDDEDHEALCNLFATIGKTIDTKAAADFMNVCFTKFEELGECKKLDSRSRFMYKDLLDLRQNGWIPRRKEEKAKTIDEIRKDFEEEERRLAAESAQNNSQNNAYRGGAGGSGARGGNDRNMSGGGDRNSSGNNRRGGDNRDFRGRGSNEDRRTSGFSNTNNNPASRPRPAKSAETDDDGFTTIGSRGGAGTGPPSDKPPQRPIVPMKSTVVNHSSLAKESAKALVKSDLPEPLSKDKLERCVDRMKAEYMQDPSNTTELLLSMDEMAGTPEAGFMLVSRYADRSMDCKEKERQAIISIISFLFENQKLAKTDIGRGLADSVEFIDAIVVDSPKAYEYLGDILAAMLQLKAIDSDWLFEQCKKLDPTTHFSRQVVTNAISAMKSNFGVSTAKAIFAGKGSTLGALIGMDEWATIERDVLV